MALCRLFTSDVGEYAGQKVKEADKALCEAIKAQGRLVKKDSYVHRCVLNRYVDIRFSPNVHEI